MLRIAARFGGYRPLSSPRIGSGCDRSTTGNGTNTAYVRHLHRNTNIPPHYRYGSMTNMGWSYKHNNNGKRNIRWINTQPTAKTVVDNEQDTIRASNGVHVEETIHGRVRRFGVAQNDQLVGEWQSTLDNNDNNTNGIDTSNDRSIPNVTTSVSLSTRTRGWVHRHMIDPSRAWLRHLLLPG
jgi:hypothetical protein